VQIEEHITSLRYLKENCHSDNAGGVVAFRRNEFDIFVVPWREMWKIEVDGWEREKGGRQGWEFEIV
jgi:hypothetical protein